MSEKQGLEGIEREAVEAWLAKGAQMSDTVASLVKRAKAQADAEASAG